MKNQTPMQNMQNNFKNLNEIVLSYFNKLELNKAEANPNYFNDYNGKGVESDFIRIYKPSTEAQTKSSFAFAFNNYQDGIEKTIVTVSIKTDKVIESKNYGYEEFKGKFNTYVEMIRLLNKTKSLNGTAIVQSFKTVFPVTTEYTTLDYTEVLNDISTKAIPIIAALPELEANKKEAEAALQKLRNQLNAKIDVFTKNLKKELKIDLVEKHTNKLAIDHALKENELKELVENHIAKLAKDSGTVKRINKGLQDVINKQTKKSRLNVPVEVQRIILRSSIHPLT